MPRILHYLVVSKRLLRIPTYLLLVTYLFVGFFSGIVDVGIEPSAINYVYKAWNLAICAIVIALWYINGTALNDYADYEIDLINLKGDNDRPLVAGVAQKQELIVIAVFTAFSAVGLASILSIYHVALLILLFSINITYSIRPFQISRRGGLAPIVLPLGYVVLPFFFGYALTTNLWSQIAYVLIGALYLQFLGRIILKDYRDVKGDQAYGKKTFLLKYGNTAVCIVSGFAIASSALLLVFVAGEYLGFFRYAIICLVCFALTILFQLSHSHIWSDQKPRIAAFGRSMTGTTTTIIASLMAIIWNLSSLEVAFIAILITVVYLWSAQNAFLYNSVGGLKLKRNP